MAEKAKADYGIVTERNVGLAVGALFILVACWPLISGSGGLRILWLIPAAIFVVGGLLYAENANVEVRVGSEKSFGLVVGAVLLLVACWLLIWGTGSTWIYWLIAALIFAAAGIFLPKVLYWPNVVWFKIGMLLGSVIAPIVMFLIFIVVFVPTGLIIRARKNDLLSLKMDPGAKSYWIDREMKPQNMNRQF